MADFLPADSNTAQTITQDIQQAIEAVLNKAAPGHYVLRTGPAVASAAVARERAREDGDLSLAPRFAHGQFPWLLRCAGGAGTLGVVLPLAALQGELAGPTVSINGVLEHRITRPGPELVARRPLPGPGCDGDHVPAGRFRAILMA